MTPLSEFAKDIAGTSKKRSRVLITLLLFLITYSCKIGYEFLSEKVTLLNNDDKALYDIDKRLDKIESNYSMLGNIQDQIVLRGSFNAYIARKDEEYHEQELFNEDITKTTSELCGKIDLIEKFMLVGNSNNEYSLRGSKND